MTLRVLSLAVIAVAVSATAAELQTVEQIGACHRDSFPDDSSVQTISMNARDRIGAVTTSKATIHWKKFDDGFSRVMMRFFNPPDLRGAGLLMIEKKARNDMFIYLPELGRVKRITSRMTSASMFGTDFSYEEFERLQGIAESAPTTRAEDGAVDGAGDDKGCAGEGRIQYVQVRVQSAQAMGVNTIAKQNLGLILQQCLESLVQLAKGEHAQVPAFVAG